MSHQPASRNSAFYWSGHSSLVDTQDSKDAIPEAPPKAAPKRHANTEAQKLFGLSRKSDEIRRYSAPIEGQQAGQRSEDKRNALRRGGI